MAVGIAADDSYPFMWARNSYESEISLLPSPLTSPNIFCSTYSNTAVEPPFMFVAIAYWNAL